MEPNHTKNVVSVRKCQLVIRYPEEKVISNVPFKNMLSIELFYNNDFVLCLTTNK